MVESTVVLEYPFTLYPLSLGYISYTNDTVGLYTHFVSSLQSQVHTTLQPNRKLSYLTENKTTKLYTEINFYISYSFIVYITVIYLLYSKESNENSLLASVRLRRGQRSNSSLTTSSSPFKAASIKGVRPVPKTRTQ